MKNTKIKFFFSRFAHPILLFIFSITTVFAHPVHHNKFISYTDLGDGETLLLIHPFATDKSLWLPQQQELKHYFRVIAPDLWGFGHSEGLSGNTIKMSEYADEIAQLLDKLDIKKAIIAGESTGGYVALAFLERYPEKVKGLILSNTQAIADSIATKKLQRLAAIHLQREGNAHLINEFSNRALSAEASDQTRLFLQNMVLVQTPSAEIAALRGMALRKDLTNTFINAQQPVLLITSDKDRLMPLQETSNLYALAKNAKIVVINNAGHLSSLEQPEQWNKAVIKQFA